MQYSLKSVVQGASIYTVGQLITKGTAFFLIPLYTHYLTPAEYGIVGYLEVISLILATVLSLGFYGAQTRYLYEKGEQGAKLGEYLFCTNIFLFLVLIVVLSLLTFCGDIVHRWLRIRDIPFNPYFLYVIWTPFFSIMNHMVILLYLAEKEYLRCAVGQILQFTSLTLMVILFVIVFQQGALGQVKGVFWGQLLFFLLYYPRYIKRFKFVKHGNHIKYALVIGVPIVFHVLAGVVLHSINRIILVSFVTMEQVGFYTLGYQIGMALSVITLSLNNAWQPNFYELMNGNQTTAKRESRRFFAFWTIVVGNISMAGVLFVREFLLVFAASQYNRAFMIARIILFGYFIQGFYYFTVSPIFYFKKMNFLPFLTGSAATLNILLNLLLIPFYGINGAAVATCISFLFLVGIVHIAGRRLFNPCYDFGKAFILLTLLLPFFVISEPAEFTLYLFIVKVGYFFIFFAISLVLFHQYLPGRWKLYEEIAPC